MGAINYGKSDYITLGIKPIDRQELENNVDFMKEMEEEAREYGGTVEDAINDDVQQCYIDSCDNIRYALKKYNLQYYHITIQPGYYEGFYLEIECNYGLFFDSYRDKKEAQKEITAIKNLLTECAGLGLVQCFPGWCTGYNDYKGTLAAIKAAVKEMRQEMRQMPTWSQYRRAEQ